MSWISSDFKSRELLDDAVYSAMGNSEKNLNGFPRDISKMVVDYLEEFSCFGENEWTTLFGRVDPAPLLPFGFFDIWNGPCPIYSDKKINATHMLVYIPATIDGKPFTLNKLGEIAKRFFPNNDNGYKIILPEIVAEMGDKLIESHWVLMTKDVLPGSRNKSYAVQQKIVASLAKKSLGYEVPDTLEAATCILAQYFSDSKTRLFNDDDTWTYTKCKEKALDSQIVVGGFTPDGLIINSFSFIHESTGVAALRKL